MELDSSVVACKKDTCSIMIWHLIDISFEDCTAKISTLYYVYETPNVSFAQRVIPQVSRVLFVVEELFIPASSPYYNFVVYCREVSMTV